MGPNLPDVARRASLVALNSASHSDASDASDMDVKRDMPTGRRWRNSPKRSRKALPVTPPRVVAATVSFLAHAAQETAQAATRLLRIEDTPPSLVQGARLHEGIDKMDDVVQTTHGNSLGPSPDIDWSPHVQNHNITALELDGTQAHLPQPVSPINGLVHDDESLAMSPNVGVQMISESDGAPEQKLPAIHPPDSPSKDGPGSPNQGRLPGFREVKSIADTAERDAAIANCYQRVHRASFSSATRLSPPFGVPGGQLPPLNIHVSPVMAPISETSPLEAYMRSSFSPYAYPPTPSSFRRQSQASETSPHHCQGLGPGGRTPESIDGNDSVTQRTPSENGHRPSIDFSSRVLPMPIPLALGAPGIPHMPLHDQGHFECGFPRCNAAPFATQYLLHSHANVHSQSRPHYCPVRGCPRGEGGTGFKRKNEMIRHGLVHDSPGYVCPFCPDREHRYPRPDNLQRHVRVHHVDKDKDDPALRDVLAQRPEGGSKGRRRRMGQG